MTNSNTEKPSILVVDDAIENRMVLRHILESKGYSVEECKNGQECVDRCAKGPPPTLIILDIMMPGLDGFDTCTKVRESHAREAVPILVASALTENNDISKAISLGANDYVVKPVDRSSLLARVESHISLAQSYRNQLEQTTRLSEMLAIQGAIGEVLPEGLIVQDAKGQILYLNGGAKDLLKNAAPESIEQVFRTLFEGCLFSLWEQEIKTISNSTESIDREFVLENARYTNVVIRSKPINVGKAARVWLIKDITHSRELEEKIRLQVQLDTVATFVRGVAHNFNNILLSFMSTTSLLSKWFAGDQKTEACLGILKRSADAGAKLTQKMMVMVRGTDELAQPQTESLAEVLNLIVQLNQEIHGQRIKFELNVESNLPNVALNVRNLSDIFSNIINNAIESIRYTGLVKIEAKLNDGGKVLVDVSDTGCGMDQETLRKVFEPFFSTKNMDSVHGVSLFGNGLGMWNVYNLVRTAGGDVSISSKLASGTSVRVEIPAA